MSELKWKSIDSCPRRGTYYLKFSERLIVPWQGDYVTSGALIKYGPPTHWAPAKVRA
jgi:hypothetical protein